ncbi:YbaB/EbfC DNA-binding family protein [Lentzea atacamensis]|uniref:YbaB/EbfC DNA-binding family protein n=2 Tax=Lentzea TaxID=165301 RepID=A0A316HUP7_9PSEU|nr:YbaB/EbfC family nucleoid-associated protein [Lentzea atacamensis]PWK84408.1 YbaB/EbfC DNA-binding family protein [Lentzea atacamensis]
MSSSLQDQLEQALAEYRQRRADLKEMQARMAEISSTATSPRNVVSATVDTYGQITGIGFPTGAYKKMAPAELADVVCDTVRKAQTMAREKMADLMEPMMPSGLSLRGKEPGKLDFEKLFPENPDDAVFFGGIHEGWVTSDGER